MNYKLNLIEIKNMTPKKYIEQFEKRFPVPCPPKHAVKDFLYSTIISILKEQVKEIVIIKKDDGKVWIEMMKQANLAGFSNMKSPEDFITGRNQALSDLCISLEKKIKKWEELIN